MALQREISNQVFEDIVNRCGTETTEDNVRKWIVEIGNVLGLKLQYSPLLHQRLAERHKSYYRRLKMKKGGHSRALYRSQMWTVPIEDCDVLSVALQQQVIELTNKLTTVERERKETHCSTVASSDVENMPTTKKRSRPISEYSDSHYRRLKKGALAECSSSLSSLREIGHIPLSVQTYNTATGRREQLDLDVEDMDLDDDDMVSVALMLKDKHMISGGAYLDLTKVFTAMPSLTMLKKKVKELNAKWHIVPTPNGTHGVQQSLRERLAMRIGHLLECAPEDAPFRAKRTLRVKLSGDGTNVGKRIHCVVFSFTILDEVDSVSSVDGIHPIAIFREPESYDPLSLALADVIKEVAELTSGIEIEGVHYNLSFYLGGDWKFLALVTGIDAANSEYACIWCKCPSGDRWDTSRHWSITNAEEGARTTEENMQLASLPKKKKKQYNVSRKPLFPTIPLNHVVIDNLHLFLRVSDILIDQLIMELLGLDSLDKAKKAAGLHRTKHRHVAAFEDFVQSLGISGFSLFEGDDSRVKWRTFTGPEKLKLMSKVDISVMLPTEAPSKVAAMQSLWVQLLRINELLGKPHLDDSDILEFEEMAKAWVVKFCTIYQKKKVTPYIHAMHSHVGQFLRQHGGLLPFTQQGIEKYNDRLTKTYFRATNMKSMGALTQVMEKTNRLEYFADSGLNTAPRDVTCGNCGGGGHYHLTCSKECKICRFTPYCGHLAKKKSDGRVTHVPHCAVDV